MSSLTGWILLPVFATVVAMGLLRPLALRIGLTDKPGGRKMHQGEIPLIGGIGIVIGSMIALAAVRDTAPTNPYFIAGLLLLLVIGVLDDRRPLSPHLRLLLQFTAAALAIFGADLTIANLGTPFSATPVTLGLGTIPFTLLMIMTSINAINMCDGSDGVAGSVCLSGFTFLALVASANGAVLMRPLILALLGGVAGFLIFNWPLQSTRGSRVFLGDAGSTTLGFALAWISIELSQQPHTSAPPIVMLWFFTLPIFDFFSCFARRLAHGKSPFTPDREHFHHLLRRHLSPAQIATLVLAGSAAFSAAGFYGYRYGVGEETLLTIWLALAGLYHAVFGTALVFRRRQAPRPGEANVTSAP